MCMRTTLDLDSSVLQHLKERQRRENKSLGEVASELLVRALEETEEETKPAALAWATQPLRARVDLEDREALQRMLDTAQLDTDQ